MLLVSPKTSFWKLSQFVAFAFGLSDSGEHHSQKGSVLPGTTCAVRRPHAPGATGDFEVLVCSKRAAGKRAFIPDKSVSTAAMFRCDPGSLCEAPWRHNSKPAAQSEADAATEVVFRFGENVRAVRVTLQAVGVHRFPMPSAVENSACNLTDVQLDSMNGTWLGGRQGPSMVFFGGASQADINRSFMNRLRSPVHEC